MTVSGNIIGLDVGQSHVTAVRLAGDDDGTLRTLQSLEVGLPRSTFDAQGTLLRPEILAEAVTRLRTVQGLKGKKCVLAVSGAALNIQPVVRPNTLWGEDLQNSVRFELEPGLPYDSDQAHITLKEIDRDPSENGTVKVLTVAVRRSVPAEIAAAVRKGGLQPVDILPGPTALPRAIATAGGVEVLLAIGMLSSAVLLLRDGQVHYAQTLPLGSDHFTGALVQAGFEPAEAEHWKRTHSLVAPDGAADPFPQHRAALRAAADGLVETVYQVMTYGASEQATDVSRLLLTGGGAQLSGLSGYLASALGLPVEMAEPQPLLQPEHPELFARQALAYALAMTSDEELKGAKSA